MKSLNLIKYVYLYLRDMSIKSLLISLAALVVLLVVLGMLEITVKGFLVIGAVMVCIKLLLIAAGLVSDWLMQEGSYQGQSHIRCF